MPARALPTLAIALAATLGLSACGGGQSGQGGQGGNTAASNEPLTIMADAEPHAALLKQAEKEGLLGDVKIEVREIAGGVDPNQLVASGDVDANYFQHMPYLKNWNAEHKANLQMVGVVHIEPLGLYSRKVKSLSEVPQNANIAIPADAVNMGRALFLLQEAGLLKLNVQATDPNLDIAQVTEKNITDNPKNITFTKIDRPQLAQSLDDPKVHLSVVNGNYAIEAGLKPDKDALILDEVANNPYANGIVTRPELVKDPRVQEVTQALQSEQMRTYITETYSGSVLPAEGGAQPSGAPTSR